MHQNAIGGRAPPGPLGELTALPQTTSCVRGRGGAPGKGNGEGKGKGEEVRGQKWERGGEEGSGREEREYARQIFQIQIQIHPSQRLHLGDQRQATSLLYSVRLLKQKCFETSLERRLIR